MPKLVCKNCGYHFNSDDNREDKICPYCGEKKLAEEKNAEELING